MLGGGLDGLLSDPVLGLGMLGWLAAGLPATQPNMNDTEIKATWFRKASSGMSRSGKHTPPAAARSAADHGSTSPGLR